MLERLRKAVFSAFEAQWFIALDYESMLLGTVRVEVSSTVILAALHASTRVRATKSTSSVAIARQRW